MSDQQRGDQAGKIVDDSPQDDAAPGQDTESGAGYGNNADPQPAPAKT